MSKHPHTVSRQNRRKNPPRRAAARNAGKLIEQLEQRVLLSIATISNNPTGTPVDGSLTVSVDAYGSFGDEFPQSGALYDPFGAKDMQNSVWYSTLYFQPIGTLLGQSSILTTPEIDGLPSVNFTQTSVNSATSVFSLFDSNGGEFDITLTQTVETLPTADSTTNLVQTYQITNKSSTMFDNVPFTMVRFMQSWMPWEGPTVGSDWAGLSGDNRIAIAFDNLDQSSVFERIDVSGLNTTGDQVADWESPVGMTAGKATTYNDQQFKLLTDIIANKGIPAAADGVVQGAAAGDLLDTSPDSNGHYADLALGDQLTIPIGQTVTYITTTGWGDTGAVTPAAYRSPGKWDIVAVTPFAPEGTNAEVQIVRTDGSFGHASVTLNDDDWMGTALPGAADDPTADFLDIGRFSLDHPDQLIILRDGQTQTVASGPGVNPLLQTTNPTIPVFNDTTIEGSEWFPVMIEAPTFGATLANGDTLLNPGATPPDTTTTPPTRVQITIPANDQPSPFHFATTDAGTSNPVTMTWKEGDDATIAVMRGGDDGVVPTLLDPTATNTGPYGNFSVGYTIVGSGAAPATPGTDLTDNTPNSVLNSTTNTITGSLFFTAATPDTIDDPQYQYIDLHMLLDNLYEGSETFTITLQAQNPLMVTDPSTFTGTITDLNTSGPVHLVTGADDVAEDAGNKNIGIVRTGSTGGQVTIGYSVAGGAGPGYAVPGTDFIVPGATLTNGVYTGLMTFDLGSAAPESPLIVQLIPTDKQQPNKILTVTLTNPDHIVGIIGSPSVETLTITNSNTPGNIHFVGGDQTIVEGPDPITGAPYKYVTLQVARDNGSQGTVSVNYSTEDGTAVAGTDYQAASGTLTWADGDTTPQSIQVKVFNNTTSPYPRADKTFSVNLTLPTGDAAALVDPSSVKVTIINNTQPGVNLGNTAFTAYEKDPATGQPSNANIVVQRGLSPGETAGNWSFSYVIIPGTALPGVDYPAAFNTTTPTTVNVDSSQDSYTLTIPALADSASLNDTTYTVRLTSATPGLGSVTSATVTIVNADASVQVDPGSYHVLPGTGNAAITITRTGRTDADVNVSYKTVDGSAEAGRDYTATTGTILIPAGQTSVTVNVPILTPVNAQLPTRSFQFQITSAALANPTADGNRITLAANTAPATVSISGLVNVTNIQLLSGRPNRIDRIVLSFSDPLDPGTAGLLSNYIIAQSGRHGAFNKSQPLSNAIYDSTSDTVTLFPKRSLHKNKLYDLSINSAGPLRSVGGQPFYTGAPAALGGTDVATFARGNHIKYSDTDGDIVTLKTKHGGSMDFVDGLNGANPALIVTGTAKTSLDGKLKAVGNGHAVIDSITNPDNVQDLLASNPLFSVVNV